MTDIKKQVVGGLNPEMITNRDEFILWLFHWFNGHYEDLGWGRREAMYKQLILGAADKLGDAKFAEQIKKTVAT